MLRLALLFAFAGLALLAASDAAWAQQMNRDVYPTYEPDDLRYATRDDRRIPVYFDQGAAFEAPNAAAVRANMVGGMSEPGRNYLRFEDGTGSPTVPAIRVLLTFTGPRNAFNACQNPPRISQGPVAYDKVWLALCRGNRPMSYADGRIPAGDPAGPEVRDFFKQFSNFAMPPQNPDRNRRRGNWAR